MTEPARSYYGQPILKAPVWRWPVPAYFFTGGVAAGSTLLATAARLTGDGVLARRCRFAAMAATALSTVFLIEDLGRPGRFLNMLRVAKPTSPMSVGSWVLSAFGGATTVAAAAHVVPLPQPLTDAAEATAALLAPVLATYTAVLIADTAVPAWHEARRELPFVFAGGALASSGGLAVLLGGKGAASARRAALAGAALELAASQAMEARLGQPSPRSGLSQAATGATVLGAALTAISKTRRRPAAVIGGVLLLAGAAAERFAIFRTGVESTRDPARTVDPQRARVADRSRAPTAAPTS